MTDQPTSSAPPLLRVAVIGAGHFGAFHVASWRRMPEVELVAICDNDRETAEELAARHGDIAVFDDPAALLSEAVPDIVDIVAPPSAHLLLISLIAKSAGPKPQVICQKPFCDGVEGALQALQIAKDSGFNIAVHDNVRFQPWYSEARRLVEDGAIGKPYQITFRLRPGDGQGDEAYLDRQPYFQKMPRFLVHETAIHWIDTFRSIMGEATGVFARLARLNPVIAGEDAGVVIFEFEGATRGVFDGNRLVDHIAEDRRRTMGEMIIEGLEGVLRLDGEGRLWRRDIGSNEETEHSFEWDDTDFGGDCVYLCNRHILGSWLGLHANEVAAERYLRNQQIEEAIYLSATKGTWMDLKLR
ncbi:MAG: Gfo/Idh/MocA family oxidoreductase [Pseudomonadota bacterium]